MELQIPAYAANLMKKLEQAGYNVWAVGGCVRDSLLGLTPHDWDLCTSALPEQTAALFSDLPLIRNGEKHGTIAVCTEGQVVEITTLRSEGSYTDGRHPDWVKFVPDLRQDLARRDFTVNAMAWSPAGGLQDPFGGARDLKAGVLRAVGDPETRFREDGLRILRGLRFAARFSLSIDPETGRAMNDCAGLLGKIAVERIYTELMGFLPHATAGLLCTYVPVICAVIPELAPAVGFQQHNPHHSLDVYCHIAHVVEAAPPAEELRLAALLHDVGKPQCFTRDENGVGHFKGHAQMGAEMAGEILDRLRCPTRRKERVVTLIAYHGSCRNTSEKAIRRLLRKLGEGMTRELLELDRADCHGKPTDDRQEVFDEFEATLDRILREAPCFSLKDLAISGRDLLALGLEPGPDLGRILNALLDRVSDGRLENNRILLLEEAQRLL